MNTIEAFHPVARTPSVQPRRPGSTTFEARRAALGYSALHVSLDDSLQSRIRTTLSRDLADLSTLPPDGLTDHELRDILLGHIGTYLDPEIRSKLHPKLIRSMRKTLHFDDPESRRTLDSVAHKLSKCLDDWFIEHVDWKQAFLRPHTCNQNICPFCSHRKVSNIVKKLLALVRSSELTRPLKLMTFTLKSDPGEALVRVIEHILEYFRTLRRRAIWKAVEASYFVVEMTWRPRRRAWHVHIHVLADSEFIKQRELSAEWKDITGQSIVVDIREADETNVKAMAYVLKYPQAIAALPRAQVREYVLAVCSSRLRETTGKWRRKLAEDGVDRRSMPVYKPKKDRHYISVAKFDREVADNSHFQALLPSVLREFAKIRAWRWERAARYQGYLNQSRDATQELRN